LQSETQVLRQIGHRIKALRAAKAWSQEMLAQKAYLHRTYIAEIETGNRNPSVRSLIKIANAFKVPVGELFPDR
jgi:transcriptional regulator with XRE-family HTH domain